MKMAFTLAIGLWSNGNMLAEGRFSRRFRRLTRTNP
jgi:hypothetical protein